MCDHTFRHALKDTLHHYIYVIFVVLKLKAQDTTFCTAI